MSAPATHNGALEKDVGEIAPQHSAETSAPIQPQLTHEHDVARAAARFGYGPLAHVNTAEAQLRPFGGEFQPGLYKPVEGRKFGNPAPLGLCAFALTTFVLSAINMGAADITEPNIVVALAFGYGGLVQLLAGMWYVFVRSGSRVSHALMLSQEMAVGNTFGATALSSYGGFWLSFAIVLTPGGFEIASSLGGASSENFNYSFGLFLMGWFIFTTILLFCTLKSTVAFFSLFFFLDLTFLLLGIAYLQGGGTAANAKIAKAGGLFGLLAAFAAWYNALAGIADNSNSFFILPVIHFPWSATGRSRRDKTDRDMA